MMKRAAAALGLPQARGQPPVRVSPRRFPYKVAWKKATDQWEETSWPLRTTSWAQSPGRRPPSPGRKGLSALVTLRASCKAT